MVLDHQSKRSDITSPAAKSRPLLFWRRNDLATNALSSGRSLPRLPLIAGHQHPRLSRFFIQLVLVNGQQRCLSLRSCRESNSRANSSSKKYSLSLLFGSNGFTLVVISGPYQGTVLYGVLPCSPHNFTLTSNVAFAIEYHSLT